MVLCLAFGLASSAESQDAAKLFKEGKKAERAGDVVRAYLRYAEAAALAPKHPEYWAHSQALRTRAAMKANTLPKLDAVLSPQPPSPSPVDDPEPGSVAITAVDLADLRRLRPPPDLVAPVAGIKDLELKGNSKELFEQAAKAFGLDTIFDSQYQPGVPRRLRLTGVDYRQALHSVEAATGSFIFPLGERLFMVAQDTPQKRAEVEPNVEVSIPIPDPVTPQEAQEMGRSVQQALEIKTLSIDPDHQMVVVRDRLSKVRLAQALLSQLAHGRPQVGIRVQFLELDDSTMYSYGFLLPSSFPITYISRNGVAGATQTLAKLFFGHTILGLGIANSTILANMSRNTSKVLLDAEVRASDGTPATFHVGNKYPIETGGFVGTGITGIPPSFTFEDLGLGLKLTPHVHGDDEMSIDVEAEFKVLAGQSVNGIPVISNRKIESKVRLRNGEWAVVAGLLTTEDARSFTGPLGLSLIPLLRQNNRTQSRSHVLVVLQPQLLSSPSTEWATRELYVGSETRFEIPLGAPSAASTDHGPAPTAARNNAPSSIEKSTRASCTIGQKPWCNSIGTLVVAIATEISMISGTAASRVSKPASTSMPNTISTTPTNGAMISGAGIPIFANRPTPSCVGKRNFWIPSERNTPPTISRTRMVLRGPLVSLILPIVSALRNWPDYSECSIMAACAARRRFCSGLVRKRETWLCSACRPSLCRTSRRLSQYSPTPSS